MTKKLAKYLFYFVLLIIIGVFYLSYFGVETKRFNEIIKNKVSEISKSIIVEPNEVKIILNIRNFNLGIKTEEPHIIIEGKKIQVKAISSNLSIISFLNKKFAIKNAKIITNENNLKEILTVIRTFKNTPELIILNKMIEAGTIAAEINLNYDDQGNLKDDYYINGSIQKGKVALLNKNIINNIDLNFIIKNNNYLIKKIKLQYNQLKIFSEKIKITDKKKYLLVEGDVSNKDTLIDMNLLKYFLKESVANIDLKNLNLSSKNNFSFKVKKKFKISNLDIDSKINIKELNYTKKIKNLKKYISSYKDSVKLTNQEIALSISKNNFNFKGKGLLSFDQDKHKISYKITSTNKELNFESELELNNIPIEIKLLDYKISDLNNSNLKIKGIYHQNKNFFFENILFKESNNIFKINGLNLNKNYKIDSIEDIYINFTNSSKKTNELFLKKNKNNYEISGENFDGTNLIDEMLHSDSEDNVFKIFNNFNSIVKINLDKTYIDDINYVNSLSGNLEFNKSNLSNVDLKANLADNKKLFFTIKTKTNGEKITTFFSEYAKPIVKKYKFIKGFEEGILDFYSLKKNNVSNSQLKINNFKLNELPVLTKILTLASLQGIADLLTGEGIRFKDFEMKFKNEKKLMTIDEIYAIGPSISILMDGYVQKNELISLRGTLVPATTLNKVIGSIPFLGKILVGKKTGEGVFGISFKIKGPPKNLKTTVNPIKTLTPRFITRTLEKIEQLN